MIDMDATTKKTVPIYRDLIAGNARLVADPARAGRYRVEDADEYGRVLGYLQTMPDGRGRVSIARLSDGLDSLLTIRTVTC